MRNTALALIAVVLVHAPLFAQDDAALQQIAEGWGRGECNLLTHVAMNPETGNWQTVEESPWGKWTIQRVGPTSVEYTMSNGVTRLVELKDGLYLDRAPEDAGTPPEDSEGAAIVEHGIHGSDNWRILLLWPSPAEEPHIYSEVIMAGDIYIWTNWMEDEDGVRRRVVYSACKLGEG